MYTHKILTSCILRSGVGGRGAPAVTYWYIFRVKRSPANACNPLAKDVSMKEMLNFCHKDSSWLTVMG